MAQSALEILITEKKSGSAIQDTKSDLDDTEKSGGSLSKTLTGVGVGMAAVGVGLTAFAKNATDTTVEFTKGALKLSRETGTTVEEASRLEFVAQRMGLSADDASRAFGKLSQEIVDANTATEAGVEPLSKLNIATKNADGSTRGFSDVLLDLADKFKEMPNGVEKTNLAMEIFGRSGKDLIPLLNQGRVGIEELMKKADELGITLSGDNIAKFQEYVTAQKDLNDSSLALKMTIGQEVIPVQTELNKKLNETLEWLLKLPSPFKEIATVAAAFGGPVLTAAGSLLTFAANVSEVLPMLKDMSKYGKVTLAVTLIGAEVAFAIKEITEAWKELEKENESAKKASEGSWEAIDRLNKKIAEMPAGEAKDKLIAMRDSIVESQKAIDEGAHGYDAFKQFLDALVTETIPNFVEGLWNPIQAFQNLSDVIEAITGFDLAAWAEGVVNGITEWFSQLPGKVGEFFGGVWDAITQWLSNAWQSATDWVGRLVNDVVNWFGQLPGRVGQWLGNMFSGIVNWFSNAWSNATNWVSRLVNDAINWFAQLPGRVGSWLSNMVGQIGSWFGNAWNNAVNWASRIVNGIVDWFGQLPGRIGGAISGIGGILGDALRNAARAAKNSLPGPIRSALDAIGFSGGGLVQGYAKGGAVHMATGGNARGTDMVPAWLTQGEYVVSRPAVNRVGTDVLDAINAGKLNKGGRDVTIYQTNHNYYEQDQEAANIELGWRLATA